MAFALRMVVLTLELDLCDLSPAGVMFFLSACAAVLYSDRDTTSWHVFSEHSQYFIVYIVFLLTYVQWCCVQVGYIHLDALVHQIGANCCCICIHCMTQFRLSLFIIASQIVKKMFILCMFMPSCGLQNSSPWLAQLSFCLIGLLHIEKIYICVIRQFKEGDSSNQCCTYVSNHVLILPKKNTDGFSCLKK